MQSLHLTSEHIEFGPFRMDASSDNSRWVVRVWKLRPKAFCALKTLIQNNGRYVDYDQMIQDAPGRRFRGAA